ncbi:hypothetical protein JG688_00005150 [Phytophthora aleatoria]|uniref:PX domain-containing protein n=1 Tax=Phytophthora aleatoria TaxID=2496075 RepID=A0A8J5J8M8_9STRA|nr:hypothetical protein JG688_00005150 [Phytophthora aleatoria]
MCTTETPSLQQLTKLTILPSRSSQLSTPLTFLDKIDHIEINDTSERNGVVFYRIAVFLKHNTSHIPTIKSTAVSDQPDYQIERRFTDFANLRCKYCGEFMSYIVHSLSQPRALIKLATGVHTRKKLLTSFCNAFIIKALAHKEHFHSLCTGYQTIPHIMEDFFRQDE